MDYIKKIVGREILDSRGNPTVEVDAHLHSGSQARASVPAGASTGQKEALELRDGDPTRFQGKGVLKAVENINHIIAPALRGASVVDIKKIDERLMQLDGTPNKAKLGANAILGVSMAIARLGAMQAGLPLYHWVLDPEGKVPPQFQMPVPMMNFLNGGAHADNGMDFQEIMILPVGANTFAEALQMGHAVFTTLRQHLLADQQVTGVGDEGGFAPSFPNHKCALDCLMKAIEKAGFTPGKEIWLGLDVASSEFYRDEKYVLSSENQVLELGAWLDYLTDLVDNYPILSIEDGMAETDWTGWQALTERLGHRVQLVGDDLFVTQSAYIAKGAKLACANAVLIKLNQVGTVTETLAAIAQTKAQQYGTVISHRSGETEDAFIADLAVGTLAGQIKTGGLSRMERIAKYNQLLRIENEVGSINAPYAGSGPFQAFFG